MAKLKLRAKWAALMQATDAIWARSTLFLSVWTLLKKTEVRSRSNFRAHCWLRVTGRQARRCQQDRDNVPQPRTISRRRNLADYDFRHPPHGRTVTATTPDEAVITLRGE